MEIKKVSIIGCGALGIMYASHMQKHFPQIQFIAAPDRLARYRQTAFRANGQKQDFRFVSPQGEGGSSDLVIFTVKYNDLRDAASLAKNHVGENTVILSFLNGITSEEILAEYYPPGQILHSMVAGMDATRTGYAVAFSKIGYVAFGSPGESRPEVEKAVADFFEAVQIRCERPADIRKELWWKFILNIGVNQTSALLKAPYGLFQDSPHAEAMMRLAMEEAWAVARKLGVPITGEDVEGCVRIMRTLAPDGKTSMCQDVEAGRPTEADMFAGTLMELGNRHAVPVPVNTFLYHAMKAMESQF